MMLLVVAAAMASDLVTFAIAMGNVGIEQEANPVMAFGYSSTGLLAVAAIKIAGTVAILWLLTRVKDRRRRWVGALLAVAITMTGTASNIVNGIL